MDLRPRSRSPATATAAAITREFRPPTTVAVRHDAPTRIFCFIEDLFFQAKISETAKKLGIKVEFVKGDKESVAKLTDVAEADRPALVVFDLNNANAKPLTLIPKSKPS